MCCYKFYKDLVDKKFFDNSILVIIGSYRALKSYTVYEHKKFGDIGIARVPLVRIGDVGVKFINQDKVLSHISLVQN